ncbi:MAG: FhlB protein [Ignavibacteria bacterium]|nr:FhlB protein [Ignavibacteria bacterium]
MKTESIRRAIALKYKDGDEISSTVVSSATSELAEEVIKSTLESEAPIHKNKKLVKELRKVDLLEQLPEELFAIAAEMLAYTFDIDTLAGKNYDLDDLGEEGA